MRAAQADLKQPRTRELVAALGRWGVEPTEHALIIVEHMFDNLHLAGRNLPRLTTNTISALNVYDVLRADKIIIEASALAFIQEFYGEAQTLRGKRSVPESATESSAEAIPEPQQA